jgi:hypothetical protein
VCVCILALVIQQAMRMRRIILSSVACLVLPYVFTLSHKRHDFRKNVTEHKICVPILPPTLVWNFSRSKKTSARYYHKVFVWSTPSSFNKSLIISTDFLKILKCRISWKFVQWEPCCSMRTKRQTDGKTRLKKSTVFPLQAKKTDDLMPMSIPNLELYWHE